MKRFLLTENGHKNGTFDKIIQLFDILSIESKNLIVTPYSSELFNILNDMGN